MFVFCYQLATAQKNTNKKNDAQSKSDSIKLANQIKREALIKKQDSIYAARELMKEKRQKELDERNEKLEIKRRKKGIPLTNEISFGYRLASDGWSFFANRGFINLEDKENIHTSYFWIDISEKRNSKEINVSNENFAASFPNEPRPLSYKYGKINNFYQFKLGYGNIKPISGKLDNHNVVINWTYGAGISLGLLKPYYLDLLLPEGSQFIRKFASYTEANKDYFLDLNNQGSILGGSNFTKGIGEIKIKPGIVLRSGFFFDYSKTKKIFTGIEIGASAEMYAQEIPIMAITKNKPFFFNLYADIRIGKRWE